MEPQETVHTLRAGSMVRIQSGLGGVFDVELIEMAGPGKWRVAVRNKQSDFDGHRMTANEADMRWPHRSKLFHQLDPVRVDDSEEG